jgi:diaminopimelate epimerase
MSIPFRKFHGFGNDYIVLQHEHAGTVPLSELARAMCNRHTGAGADGIAVLRRSEHSFADFYCEIVNPDGSIAGFSGNGTRCAAAFLYYEGLWTDLHVRLQTRSGLKTFSLMERRGAGSFLFEAEIGHPKFTSSEIPVAGDERGSVIDESITVNGDEFRYSAVNVGNPVACIFVKDLEFDWRTPGIALETHPHFPERANIVFVRVEDRQNIQIRIWERGAGETSASGTCSSGAAVLSAFTGRTERELDVHSPGGISHVLWRDDDEIVLTGRADLAYCGEWPD